MYSGTCLDHFLTILDHKSFAKTRFCVFAFLESRMVKVDRCVTHRLYVNRSLQMGDNREFCITYVDEMLGKWGIRRDVYGQLIHFTDYHPFSLFIYLFFIRMVEVLFIARRCTYVSSLRAMNYWDSAFLTSGTLVLVLRSALSEPSSPPFTLLRCEACFMAVRRL
jgi:hypothetical protein